MQEINDNVMKHLDKMTLNKILNLNYEMFIYPIDTEKQNQQARDNDQKGISGNNAK